MTLPDSPIEAVRNRKTLKLFIIVDDTLENRYKVINPGGEIIVLPDLLFEEDPLLVAPEQIAAEFTAEQLDALAKHNEKLAAAAKAQAERPKPVTKAPPAEPPAKARSSSPRPPRKAVDNGRRGLGATWSAPRLTFYRHKIEPLGMKQSFKILVEGAGDFEITKEEFLAQFNDVVMSPSYRADGLYTYPKVPDKARRYLKARG